MTVGQAFPAKRIRDPCRREFDHMQTQNGHNWRKSGKQGVKR